MSLQPRDFAQLLEIFREYLYEHVQPYHCGFIAMQCKLDGFLTEAECTEILHTEDSRRTLKLIEILCQRQQPGLFQSFISSLNAQGLGYVAQQLTGDPVSASFFQDYYTHVVTVFYGQVSNEVEASDILDIYGPELLDDHSRQVIEAQPTKIDKTAKLLYLVAKRPGMMEKFIDRLRSTEVYGRLLQLLEGDTEEKRCFLDVFLSNASLIEEQLEPRDILDFMDLPNAKRDHIRNLEPRNLRVKSFLNILVNQPFGWFKNFVSALRRPEVTTDYSDLIKVLDLESTTEDIPSTSRQSATSVAEKVGPSSGADVNVGYVFDVPYQMPLPEKEVEGRRHSFALRNYQLELAEPATQGNNCVIVAPTGSGKTCIALHICKKHLTTEDKKVVFLVPTVPLVQQHYDCFRRHLEERILVAQVSGGNDTNADVAEILDANHVLIMTHQVLLNVLKNNNFDISDISLLMFDECHHTMKEHPYKQIMDHYMKKKTAAASSGSKLPQIVGLTASPGSGKAKTPEKALEYIKQFLGNLDVTIAPVQVVKNLSELSEYAKLNEFDTIPITRPENDRFSEVLKSIMEKIEKVIRAQLADKASASSDVQDLKLELSPKRGSQKYEQDIVAFQDQSAILADKTLNKTLQIYAKHLRVYNDALLVSEHARPSDARDYIKKTLFSEAPVNEMERKLKEMYEKSGVVRLASDQPSPLLEKLLQLLIEHFSAKPESRCIVFARTREIAISLVKCCLEDPKRQVSGLQPEYLTGSGPRSIRGGMTKVDQEDLLQRFKEGTCKLLITTTVAEEGLDIRACNLVVTYNHTTNEVAQVQRKGRGRAKGSKMYVLAYSDRNFIEKEKANAARNKLTLMCLQQLREMDPDILAKQIADLQLVQLLAFSLEVPIKPQTSDRVWELQCRKCHQKATTSDQIRHMKGMHHIVVDPTFPAKRKFISTTPESFSADEVKIGMVRCGNSTCNNDWGMQMSYKNVPLSVLKASSFVVVNDHGLSKTMKRWKNAPFRVDNLSESELAKLEKDQL